VVVSSANGGYSIVNGSNQAIIDPVNGSFPGYAAVGGYINSRAFAEVTSSSARLMSLYAHADSNTGGGFTPAAAAFSSGTWRDVVYLEPGLAPEMIQLHFSFSGELSLSLSEDGWGNKYGSVGFRAYVNSQLSGYKSNRFNWLDEGGSGSCSFESLNA